MPTPIWQRSLLVGMALTAGCSSGSPTAPPSAPLGSVAFYIATRSAQTPSGSASVSAGRPDLTTVTLGSNTLVIDSVQLVIKKIELRRPEAPNCESDGPGVRDCDELKVGPLRLDLPLTPGAAQVFTVPVDTGTFVAARLEIHKVSARADSAFAVAQPALKGRSIRVVGHFNDTAFVYSTDLEVEQEMELSPPVTVGSTKTISLTLSVDVSTWFLTEGGAGLIDPATATPGTGNAERVKHNIQASFRQFEDERHEGHENR